jgi:hypothetical protein
MTLDATKPENQATVSELATYLRETRTSVNSLSGDVTTVETALNVDEAGSVGTANVVQLATNLENAVDVTSAGIVTTANDISGTSGDVANAENIELAAMVTNADLVSSAGTVNMATAVTEADTVTNATNITNVSAIENVTTITQANDTTIINATTVNEFGGVTATAAELNILDGATLSTAELNILDGVTANASGINTASTLCGGITATAAEINKACDGVGVSIPKIIKVDIGDWNMDADPNKIVNMPSGVTYDNVIGWLVSVRSDSGESPEYKAHFPLVLASSSWEANGEANCWPDNTVGLTIKTGGTFDATNFNRTSYNRGWIILFYID